MNRRSKSQWDFGELFPTEAQRRILTVSELTSQVKRLLEKELGRIWVAGEITNLRVQTSGHIYFTLKDANSQVGSVLFRGEPIAGRELLEDGRKVLVQGDLTVYEPRGQYQLVVRAVEFQGVGALQMAFEKLKQKLNAEGLFAAERKRALPEYPQRIGLVTSLSGAAIRDVLHVVQRRQPALEIILVPCRVQGAGAAAEIANAVRLLNHFNSTLARPESGIDLILVTRGGGSLEDLWAFNEEIVARAIFESAVPIVSAVGHEVDFTISDFVADLRAATPSAAAEIITEGAYASREFVAEAADSMRQRIQRRLGYAQEDLRALVDRVARVHPRRRFNDKLQLLDDLETGLARAVKSRWRECGVVWHGAHQRLLRIRPAQRLGRRWQTLVELDRRLQERLRQGLRHHQSRFANVDARLRLLSPANVLDRGYSITMDAATGEVIRDSGDSRDGQHLKTRLKRGEIWSVVASGGRTAR